MGQIAKILIISGVVLVVIGVGIFVFLKFKIPFLGRLPGDIYINKKNFSFYLPITTCIIISLILTIIGYIFFKK